MNREKALWRYGLIATFIADEPRRGQRRKHLEHLANKTWIAVDGTKVQVSWETLRSWVRRYQRGGVDALGDAARAQPGVSVLSEVAQATLIRLREEVPERSLDQILKIIRTLELLIGESVSRSTLHRLLQSKGISGRTTRTDNKDLDRFEASKPNDLWQSDMLVGPTLFDPNTKTMRKIYLYAFIDDHSRYILYGRWSFKGDLPALELVFRRCLERYGTPRRVYYDNGAVYRSHHMKHIVAELGLSATTFTTPYRPEGHGKVEAMNRTIRSHFIAELGSTIFATTLDEINEAFVAWVQFDYNIDYHSEIKCTPKDRFDKAKGQERYADERKLDRAFLWRETRTAKKDGLFRLFSVQYQVGPELANRKIEVRYDPEYPGEVGGLSRKCTQRAVEAVRGPATQAPQSGASPNDRG